MLNYPYANGTIKALENKVLDRNKLFVLAKYDKTEFVNVLLAMNYGNIGSTVEELILNEMKKTKEVINSVSPCIEDTNLFYLVNDAQNIKILYKIKNFNLIDKEQFLQDNGGIDNVILANAILNDDLEPLTKKEKNLIISLNEKTKDITNPKDLSIIIDDEMYKYSLNTANHIMKVYLVAKIDITNVTSMLRSKNLNWSFEDFEKVFITGGKININIFKEIYDKDLEIISKAFAPYYNEKISRIISAKLGFSRLEVEFDRLILTIMAEYKDDPFTIGPLIYYYLLKQAESLNVRLLYSSVNVELRDLI